MSNEIDEKLFEKIFVHKFETLANKLINTTDKAENQNILEKIKRIFLKWMNLMIG